MRNTILDDFNPNNNGKSPVKEIWATYIPSRLPKFKVHHGVGLAKSAFTYSNFTAAIIYKWEAGQWVEKQREDYASMSDEQRKHELFGYPCEICGIDNFISNGIIMTDVRPRWIGANGVERAHLHECCSNK